MSFSRNLSKFSSFRVYGELPESKQSSQIQFQIVARLFKVSNLEGKSKIDFIGNFLLNCYFSIAFVVILVGRNQAKSLDSSRYSSTIENYRIFHIYPLN